MASGRKIVIKINQSLDSDSQVTTAAVAENDVTWHWGRIITASIVVVLLLMLLNKLFFGASPLETSINSIKPTNSIQTPELLPIAIDSSKKTMQQNTVPIPQVNSVVNVKKIPLAKQAKVTEKIKHTAVKKHRPNKLHIKHS